MVNLGFPQGPVWYEVWPAGWGFYRIYECDGGLGGNGLLPGRYVKATVFGRNRATKRAEAFQEAHDTPPAPPMPIFSKKDTAWIEDAKIRSTAGAGPRPQ